MIVACNCLSTIPSYSFIDMEHRIFQDLTLRVWCRVMDHHISTKFWHIEVYYDYSL